jgi:hypothetical protein
MRWTRAVAVTACASAACTGVHQEKQLPVSPPIQEARVRTFGWSRALGLGQEIWVTLDPGVSPSRVVDLSGFAPLRPGTTGEDAIRLIGQPARTWQDDYGQPWYEYDRVAGKLQVGCECQSSGSSVTTNCLWRLYLERPRTRPEHGLTPQLLAFVSAARSVPEKVDSRVLQLNTADNGEFVSWTVESERSPAHILWHDRKKSVRGGLCKGA